MSQVSRCSGSAVCEAAWGRQPPRRGFQVADWAPSGGGRQARDRLPCPYSTDHQKAVFPVWRRNIVEKSFGLSRFRHEISMTRGEGWWREKVVERGAGADEVRGQQARRLGEGVRVFMEFMSL